MTPRDEDLAARIRTGDEGALIELIGRYEDAVTHRVQRRLPARLARRVSVADVLQETRLTVARDVPDFRGQSPGAFRNWLLTVVDHKVHELVRNHLGAAKRGVEREVSRDGRAATEAFAAGDASPSEVAIGAELAAVARSAMRSLQPDYREVLSLARGEQLTLREVAERMGRSRDAVKKLYWRALQQFKARYEQLAGERDE